MNPSDLESALCRSLCAQFQVLATESGLWQIHTPFAFPDGDELPVYIKHLPSAGMRITDAGLTFMRLSCEIDFEEFREGSRGRLLEEVLLYSDIHEDDGELFIEVPADQLGPYVIKFGQALTRLHSIAVAA